MSGFWRGFMEQAGQRTHENDMLQLEQRAKQKQDLYNFYTEMMNNPRLRVDRYQDILNAAQSVLAVQPGKEIPKNLYPESLLQSGPIFWTREELADMETRQAINRLKQTKEVEWPYTKKTTILEHQGDVEGKYPDVPVEELSNYAPGWGMPPNMYEGRDFGGVNAVDVTKRRGGLTADEEAAPPTWEISPVRDKTVTGQSYGLTDPEGNILEIRKSRVDPFSNIASLEGLGQEGIPEGWIPLGSSAFYNSETGNTNVTDIYGNIRKVISKRRINLPAGPGQPTQAPTTVAPAEPPPGEGQPAAEQAPVTLPQITRPPAGTGPGLTPRSATTIKPAAGAPPVTQGAVDFNSLKATYPMQEGETQDQWQHRLLQDYYATMDQLDSSLPSQQEMSNQFGSLDDLKKMSDAEVTSRLNALMQSRQLNDQTLIGDLPDQWKPSNRYRSLLESADIDVQFPKDRQDVIDAAARLLDDPDLIDDPMYKSQKVGQLAKRALTSKGLPIPKHVPDDIKEKEAFAAVTLMGLNKIRQLVLKHPYLIGMIQGRWINVLQMIGTGVTLNSFDQEKAQELSTRLQYFLVMEAKVLMGSRPALAWAERLAKVTADKHMTLPQLMGSLAAAADHASFNIKEAAMRRWGSAWQKMTPSLDAPWMPGAPHQGDVRLNWHGKDFKDTMPLTEAETGKLRADYEIAETKPGTNELWWTRIPDGDPPTSTRRIFLQRIWPPPNEAVPTPAPGR